MAKRQTAEFHLSFWTWAFRHSIFSVRFVCVCVWLLLPFSLSTTARRACAFSPLYDYFYFCLYECFSHLNSVIAHGVSTLGLAWHYIWDEILWMCAAPQRFRLISYWHSTFDCVFMAHGRMLAATRHTHIHTGSCWSFACCSIIFFSLLAKETQWR